VSYLCTTSSVFDVDISKHQRFDEVREIFTEIHTKSLDWPEAIWEAWISFENAHGTVEELEECLDKIDRAQYQTNARRARVRLVTAHHTSV